MALHMPPNYSTAIGGGRQSAEASTITLDRQLNILIRDVLNLLASSLYPHDAAPDFRRGRLHSFRHFFCPECYRAGMQERQILDLMGHSDSAITRLYRHFAEDEHRGAIDQLTMVGDFNGAELAQEESSHDANHV